jgi:hypothetical protein
MYLYSLFIARSLGIYVYAVDTKNPTQGTTGSLSLNRRLPSIVVQDIKPASLFPTSDLDLLYVTHRTDLNNAELRGSSTERIPFGTYLRAFFLVFAEFVLCCCFDADNTWCIQLR